MAEKQVERVRKITLKVIGAQADIEKLLAAEGKRLDLCDVYGVATKAKPGTSDHGAYVAFLGQFRATNLATRQVFESGKCILPKFIEEELYGALGGDTTEGGNVQFAIRISAKYEKDAATKYVYDMRSIIPTKENAQLVALENAMKEGAKALPAPRLK